MVLLVSIHTSLGISVSSRFPFIGEFDDEQLNTIQAHPDVALVTEDAIAYACDTFAQYILIRLRRQITNNLPRTDAFWGAARLSQDGGLAIQISEDGPHYGYNYDNSSGNEVDIYILGEFYAYLLLCSFAQRLLRYRGLY
jgi:hypothetical protein